MSLSSFARPALSPANVTDGNINSSWCSNQSNSFTLDLQNTNSMGKIVVYPLQAHRVTVSTSTDNVNWTERYKTNWPPYTSMQAPIAITADGTYSARYVKFFADADWPQYVGIMEMEVYEWLASPPPPPPPSAYGTTNLALGRPVLNSFGAIVPSNPPGNAVDGDADTSWRSGAVWVDSTGRYHEYGAIRIELDNAYKIGKITVNPENVQWYFIAMSELPGDAVPGISSPWVPGSSPWVFASYPELFGTTTMSTEPSTFYLDGTVTARYIWLYIQADTGFTYVWPGVSEIQVYEWGALVWQNWTVA
jgi:hypothetical protein